MNVRLILWPALSLSVALTSTLAAAAPVSPAGETIGESVNWPLYFERNQGQIDAAFDFRIRGAGLPLATSGIRTLTRVTADGETKTLVTQLVGANRQPAIPEAPLVGRVSYLRGGDETPLHDIPTFARVRYRSVYPRTDLVLRGAHGRLEYDFELSPGADPDQLVLAFEGARHLKVDPDGSLLIDTGAGILRHHRPVAWQPTGEGVNEPVTATFRLLAANRVGFEVAGYDPGRALVIDPMVTFSSYLGGSSDQRARAIAVDGDGMVYITGTTGSDDFPVTAGAHDDSFNGGGTPIGDVFVAKLNPEAGSLVYATYVGGTDGDEGFAIAVDGDGAAYVTGKSFSEDFPTTAGAFDTSIGPASAADVIVFKLNPAGSALEYSTWLEGQIPDGKGIAVDSNGNAYVSGTTTDGFPTRNPILGFQGGFDIFVSKLNADGSDLIYSTYIGGSGDESIIEDVPLTIDGQGNVYVAGTTDSDDFPVTPDAAQATRGGDEDAFLVKLNAAGTAILYATYLGGGGDDEARGVGVDAFGRVVLIGETGSSDFPLVQPIQPVFGGSTDGFVARYSPGGNLAFSSYLGKNLADSLEAVAVLANGDAYVAGEFLSSTIDLRSPLPLRFQPSLALGVRNYLAKLTGNPLRIEYSTFVGGTGGFGLSGVASDGAGTVFLVGTVADNLPTVQPVQAAPNGFRDAFVSVVRDPGSHGIGAFAPDEGRFRLRNDLTRGFAQLSYQYGPAPSALLPLMGDWDGDGVATPGLYDSVNGRFLLRNVHSQGPAQVGFPFGPRRSNWQPLAGDWDQDGMDSVGLYDRARGLFFLALNPTPGTAVTVVRYGPIARNWVPLAGDWDLDGSDGIGLYDPAGGRFFFRNDLTPGGGTAIATRYGPLNAVPVIGDWNGDGAPGLGVYHRATARFLLSDSLAGRTADYVLPFGPANSNWIPLAADWDGL